MYGAVIAKAAEEMRKPQVRHKPSRAVPLSASERFIHISSTVNLYVSCQLSQP